MPAKPALGVIGLGLMGAPFARRLVERGYGVTAYDLDEKKIERAAEAGAAPGASPAALAAASDLVMLFVTDTKSVETAVFGENGVVGGAANGKVLMDLSTTELNATREMAARLERETGMGWVDAPVSGGPPAAAAGTLTVMAGGTEEDIARVRPLMADIAGRFTHMGPVGAGQSAKLINQVLVGSQHALLAEAIRFAENLGLDPLRLSECLAGGYADSVMLQKLLPRMAGRAFEPPASFARQLLKDLDMVLAMAKQTQSPLPITSEAGTLYRLLVSRGHGMSDSTAILKLYDKAPI
jgi:3-hydroxyisobutyrate dehydrogenase